MDCIVHDGFRFGVLPIDGYYACQNYIDLCSPATVLRHTGTAVAQFVELRQIPSLDCSIAWTASTAQQPIATSSLEVVALRGDQMPSGFFVSNYNIDHVIAVF